MNNNLHLRYLCFFNYDSYLNTKVHFKKKFVEILMHFLKFLNTLNSQP